jgi:hypothetical protein
MYSLLKVNERGSKGKRSQDIDFRKRNPGKASYHNDFSSSRGNRNYRDDYQTEQVHREQARHKTSHSK